ncbi:MAG: DUF5591 domain-containing protein [Candidatus Methanomethylophilaceae archaeon]|nr:DUF5591 domain-containing protein [Candidatus Methanomethylophilaceae archaeon]
MTTPCVMKVIEGACDDPMYISVDDGKRIMHVMGDVIELDTKLMSPESSDVISPVVSSNGIAVIRLPFTGEEEIPEGTEIVVISNAYELRKDARKVVKAIISIREKVGPNVVLCAPGMADSSTLALYSYMGIDVFDDSVARVSGSNGILSIPEGDIIAGGDTTEENIKAINEECSKILHFIRGERLRELVDQRAPSSASSVAVLRIFDDEGYAYQEEMCSTVGCRFSCNTTQALRRPEVLRYRNMIMERYEKPEHKRVLVLLPCSAKKPYHISKTHRRFASAIHTADHDSLVHEVIVTSPLGAVPRELDVFFPPKSYDIPVTGQWKPEEKEFIRELVGHIIEQGYDTVISHLGEDTELVSGLCEMKETVVGDPTSPASLQNLDNALREATKGMEGAGDYKTDRRETIRSVLTFQFGREIADAIMDEDTYGIGKFPYWKIMRGKDTQLGMLTEERGMISMTLEGAKILAEHNYHIVDIMDFELKGSLFAVGVKDADPSIRIGDEAVVLCNGEVKAVGVAMMSGREMKELNRA